MADNNIAALAIVCIFGLPILGWIAVRAFQFVERMEMIKRGMVPQPRGGRRAWRDWAAQNSAFYAAPGSSAPPPQQQNWSGCDDDGTPERALHKGIRTAFIGFALLIGLSFIGGTPGTPDFHGGPWLLGGLVPMFVGIAQIIIAVLSGAQFPGVRPQVMYNPPPQPPPPGTSPPPGATPWQQQQPGRSPFEELSKPTPPPDRR